MTTRAVVVWKKGEPVRLPRGYARARASSRRPKLCSDTLIDLIADMEFQRQAKQGSDGAAKCTPNNGAASEVRVVEQVKESCPFLQVAGSGQFLREDIGLTRPSTVGKEARVQAGDGKSEDERLLDELKALRLQVLGLGAQEEASN